MSFFIVPTEPHQRRVDLSSFGRCGPATQSHSGYHLDPFQHTSAAIPRSLVASLFDVDDDDDNLRGHHHHLSRPWQQSHAEHVQRQEYLQEVQRRQRYLQQLEQEKQLREHARRERAARVALHRQQQERALALEYQRRVEAYQKRQQELAALERARLAKKRQQQEWGQIASEALFGMINLAEHFFGEDEEAEKDEEKKVAPEKAKDAGSNEAMQVDQEEKVAAPAVVETAIEPQAPAKEQVVAEDVKKDRLVFTYPLPADEDARSTIRAEDIQVTFDEASNTIQLSGLWPVNGNASASSSSSSTVNEQGDETTRGRKRSRSPKKSRVSDVDEKTGEEIQKMDEDEEYVEVKQPKQDVVEKAVPITKSLRLPEDTSVQGLRAELTDDGFQVWVH